MPTARPRARGRRAGEPRRRRRFYGVFFSSGGIRATTTGHGARRMMSRRAAEDDLAEPAAAFDAHHDHLRVALDGDVEDRLGYGDLDLLGDREALDLEALARCERR